MNLPTINPELPAGVPLIAEEAETEIQNVNLVINQEVLNLLKTENISINDLFILVAMYHEQYGLLDIYDENSSKRAIVILAYQHLFIHGLLEYPKEDSNLIYVLSEKGKSFVERVSIHFQAEEPEKEDVIKLRELSETYLLLFPKIKLPSGVYARVSSTEIEKKFKAFIKTYKAAFKKDYGFKLTEEDILQATTSYINRFAKNGYLYMMNSSYFIQKKEKSALADEILAMKNGLTSATVDKYTKQI